MFLINIQLMNVSSTDFNFYDICTDRYAMIAIVSLS